MSSTRESATSFVIAALESTGAATAADFDIPGIVAKSHAIVEGWDFSQLERSTFWNIAASHLKF